MKKILLVILLGITIFICIISGIAVPVMAFTYHDEYIYYPDYEVANYTNVPIVINKDTFNNKVYGWLDYSFNIKFSSCPSANKQISMYSDIRNSSTSLISTFAEDIVIACSTSYQTIQYTLNFDESDISAALLLAIKEAITQPDDKFIYFNQRIFDNAQHITYNGVEVSIRNLEFTSTLAYEFNTTYYFDHLALDTSIDYPIGINATVNNVGGLGNSNVRLLLFYDSTNYYRIWNSDYSNVASRGRKKYHIPLSEMHTAYGIGVSNYSYLPYDPTTPSASYTILNGLNNSIIFSSKFYLINYSNTQQTFPGATTIPDWTYDTCGAWDIPCHLGNALVYLATDAPITSSIYSVVSNAWEVIANGLYAFSSIFGATFDSSGNLISGNIVGILIVVSLGILIITWGVNSDD